MRFTYNQYNYYESGYRIPSKIHHSNCNSGNNNSNNNSGNNCHNVCYNSSNSTSNVYHPHHYKSNFGMRTTMSTMSTMSPRIHRKGFRTPSKRHPGKAFPGKLHSVSRIGPGKIVPGKRFPIRPHPPPCDNSNDSGFGFDQHVEIQQQQQPLSQQQQQQQTGSSSSSTNISNSSSSSSSSSSTSSLNNHQSSPYNQQQSSTLLNGSHTLLPSSSSLSSSSSSSSSPSSTLSHHQHSPQQHMIRAIPSSRFIASNARGMSKVAYKRQPITPPNSVATSSNGRVQLEIVSQPEQQHRARYQTEGSRGAVKDRSGNGFPVVRLIGYNKAAMLQVFIGTDIGRVAPHMFYQACKVAGKNSTHCNEKKVDGTVLIEIDFKPELGMVITCDCVGILKERNVDVEHRFPDHLAQKNKKKSTRCRMVFRTQLTHDDGTLETLQVCSNPIICTQPPGIPEISKKSLNSCPVDGGLELFIIGKNFFKDTHVIFHEAYEPCSGNNDDDLKAAAATTNDLAIIGGALWEQIVFPDKEYLQQTHLICTVPPFINQNILKPVTVQVSIVSSGKKSEPHTFVYTPKDTYTPLSAATTLSSTNTIHSSLTSAQDGTFMDTSASAAVAAASNTLWPTTETKHEIDADMMPPPTTTQMPMIVRRPSLNTTQPLISDQQLVHINAVVAAEALKTELLDESSQNSLVSDTLHSSESVVAGCGVAGPQSPTALQYHSRYGRKASMDALMFDSNSMQAFPVAATATTTTSMEVAVAAAVEMAVKNEIAKAVSVAKVDKFITDLAQSANVADATDTTQESSLFGVTNTTAIDHALTDILTTPQTTAAAAVAAAAAAVVLERSLSNSSANSTAATGSPLAAVSPSNTLTNHNHNSPITQDIILNSEPSVQLTPNLPLQQLLPNGGTASVAVSPEVTQSAGLSTDIIMNPSVSPSTILCSDNGAATAVVPNIMAPHQVTMANSILNDIAMQAQPTQQDATVAALALSNIIMSPPSDTTVTVPPTPDSMQPEVTTATSTAVSNMIIKAAADFISNQEQQTQHHHHCHNTHTPPQQIMATQNVTADSLSCNPLNLLLNHTDVVPTTKKNIAQTNVIVNDTVSTQFSSLGMAPPPQESLIVALATENVLQKSVAAAAITSSGSVVTQETAPTPSLHPVAAAAVGAVAAAAAAAVAPLAPIPQDLTTMSDQDLLSYINPSTFDQV